MCDRWRWMWVFCKIFNLFTKLWWKTSEYLHCLQLLLNTAMKRGGVTAAECNQYLLKQFCRGCWENAILSLELDRSNTKDILVITDHFTKYAVAMPTPNQKACIVAKAFLDIFLVHYGFPECLNSDPGRDFESKTIKELCERCLYISTG